MASSIISDFRPFFPPRDLLLGINSGVVRLQFYRYGLPDLTSPSKFWSFSHGIFVPAATSSKMVIHILGSPTTSTRLFSLFSLEYWCWYSRRCGLIILMAVRVHVALALRLKSKICKHLLVFAGIWYDICAIIFWLPSEKYKIMS
jgi:hypothetical protein